MTTYPGGVASALFELRVPATGRLLDLNLGAPITGTRTCLSLNNCNADGPLDALELTDWDLRVKPLVDGTWEDLPGGLFAMSCAKTYPALVHYTFWLPSANGHWGLNLNPRAYPGTTAATLSRTGNLSWTVEAESDDIAELLSWDHNKLRGNQGPSREGRFNVPFKFTINAVALIGGAKTCS
jgi:hypothetical protein